MYDTFEAIKTDWQLSKYYELTNHRISRDSEQGE